MRNAFIETLVDRSIDAKPWLITGDLGWNAIEPFIDAFPDRFLNAGVSEQAMTSLAAGVASRTGEVAFTYSIANFTTFRCLEQIRNDVVHHDNPVVVVSLGAGFTYGTLGYTHFGIEDVGAIRALPDIPIYSPCDADETRTLTRHAMLARCPAYLRLGRAEALTEPPIDRGTTPGILRMLADGDDAAIIATGPIVLDALDARQHLLAAGIEAAVYSAHTIRPFDVDTLSSLVRVRTPIITVEEHRISGGLASEILETADLHGLRLRHLGLGIERLDNERAGTRRFLLERHGLDGKAIADRIQRWLGSHTHD